MTNVHVDVLQVAASAKEAIPYYEAFLDSFKVNGKLPAK